MVTNKESEVRSQKLRGKRAARMIFILASIFCLLSPALRAQQTEATTQPLFSVNSKYVQGRTWADYKASAGTGLTLNIAAGTVWCSGTLVTYAGGTLALTNNATNYVYLDGAASCIPAKTTSAIPATGVPVASVVTSGGAITTVTDMRVLLSTTTASLAIKYAEKYAGATYDAKVLACIADAVAAGPAICDARGLTGAQSMTDDIPLYVSTTPATLLMGDMSLTRTAGKSFKFIDKSKLIGEGSGRTFIYTSGTVAADTAIVNGNGGFVGEVTLKGFWIQAGAYQCAQPTGSVGIDWSMVRHSLMEDVFVMAETPVVLGTGDAYDCACYNEFRRNQFRGGTKGLHVKGGSYSNKGYGDVIWACGGDALTIDADAGKNSFYDVDTESSGGKGASIAGWQNIIIAAYQEANATSDVTLESGARGNTVLGGVTGVTNLSVNFSNYYYVPADSPNGTKAVLPQRLGVSDRFIFGTSGMDDCYPADPNGNLHNLCDNQSYDFSELGWHPYSGGYPNKGIGLSYRGGQVKSGNYGPAPWVAGYTQTHGSQFLHGSFFQRALSNPTTPTLACDGSGTGTTYSYALVYHDWNEESQPTIGGPPNGPAVHRTLPSAFATIDCPNAPSATHPITITMADTGLNAFGIYSMDVLATDDTHSILTGVRCTPGTIYPCQDTGQASSAYTPPTRNETGDAYIPGLLTMGTPLALSSGGTGASTTATSGRYLKGDGTNWGTSTGSASGTGSCTNQFVTATNSDAAPTCTTATLASAQFANQGTTTTLLHGNAAGQPTFGAVVVADVTAVLKTRQFGFMVGSDTGSALADTDDQTDIYVNRLGQGITITEVWCACDGGSPTIQLQKDDGSPSDMLSSNLTCSSGSGASTTSFASGEAAIADGNRIDFKMVTAGGTAKRITVYAKYTLD